MNNNSSHFDEWTGGSGGSAGGWSCSGPTLCVTAVIPAAAQMNLQVCCEFLNDLKQTQSGFSEHDESFL